MELTGCHCSSSFLFLLLLSVFAVSPAEVSCIGINYGQIGDNLPSPEDAVPLVKSIGANKVKLYDANPQILKAFANSGVEFIVGLSNDYLSKMRDPSKSLAWVKQNVQAFLPATNITCVTVGNEVLALNDTSLSRNLLPAMKGVHSALVSLGLDKHVSVTTAHSLSILQTSFPPSAGDFQPDLIDSLTPILDFHRKTGSPFLINAYPFFAYKSNPKQVSVDYVLFQPNEGVVDPSTDLHYDNMLFAQIDAVYSALASIGYKSLPVQISETGWPSKGDADEFGATTENAKKYNGNLLKLMMSKKTKTPLRPNNEVVIYVFALFNEDMKPGPTSERNYGLFKHDGSPAYSLGTSLNDFGRGAGNGNNTSAGGGEGGGGESGGTGVGEDSGNGGGGGAGEETPAPPKSSSTGYLAISSSARKRDIFGAVAMVCILIARQFM